MREVLLHSWQVKKNTYHNPNQSRYLTDKSGQASQASFGAPNQLPVRDMVFGSLVRLDKGYQYLEPDINACSFRIRSRGLYHVRTPKNWWA